MYIGKIFNCDLNFPIENDISILIGTNGSGKTHTLNYLKQYFENNGENVLYFPDYRYFTSEPYKTKDIINSFIVMKKLTNEIIHINSDYLEYDLNKLYSYHNKPIYNGIIQWINFMGNILLDQRNDKIVIIDTPETNMDITLRRQLLDDILSIGSIKKLIVCTHAPEIIGDRYDYIVNIDNCLNLYK